MKYYVIEISSGDSKIAGKAVYEYDTQNAAIASFHQKLATAMNSSLYTSDLVMVIDAYGAMIKREVYTAVVATEEEVTEA